jgi:integrase
MAENNDTKKITNKVNFTAGRVASFKCPEGKRDAFLWDTKQQGLGLRAYPSGRRAYIFQVSINNKTQRAVIGDEQAFSIDQARNEAAKLKIAASNNIKPSKIKRERVAAAQAEDRELKRGQVTLGQVWAEYIEANRPNWGEKHYKDHLKAVQPAGIPWARGKGLTTKQGCLYPLINTTLGSLTAIKIKNWLDKENQTRSGVAAQTYRLLFACLNWTTEQEEYIGLVDIATLRTKAVKKTVVRMKAREDVLQKEQLQGFFQHVRHIQNPVISAFVQALLLTGARRGELSGLKWGDVDFQWNSLTIRDKNNSKGGLDGVRVIPLTPYLANLLNQLPRRNEWVFSSPTGKTGKLTEPRKSIDPAFKAAGIEGLTLHGLRRSFSTLSEWVEVPAGVVAQIMGHKPSATAEKHYKQRPLDLLRKWHTTIEAWILEQAGLQQPTKTEQRLKVVEA